MPDQKPLEYCITRYDACDILGLAPLETEDLRMKSVVGSVWVDPSGTVFYTVEQVRRMAMEMRLIVAPEPPQKSGFGQTSGPSLIEIHIHAP